MNISMAVTAVLDWIGQWLTGAPLWIQTPLVMVAVLLICVPLAAMLLKVINTAGNMYERVTGRGDGVAVSRMVLRSQAEGPGGVRIVSISDPVVPGD
ncbi:hypothetical protein M0E87_03520 [Corynebacterium sp. CCM 9185]|uniref:Uncharacterized protein n=1 Tax=Corynebacterium marambiense TaxID=2765364 RepID=A0ABS0VZD2_9CORY|nr:hypothetical protein [Corynebacterium marambiense]MBI9000995.1 hypothetical protein [Corynebacterium marambiense]MCK7662734.1 hypothetical protein [Corynebacterium marambiense]MCX7543228.1 hypothetical protein [Corynebacterium marambiense]